MTIAIINQWYTKTFNLISIEFFFGEKSSSFLFMLFGLGFKLMTGVNEKLFTEDGKRIR